jgi:predicted nucleotidyltransferase
MHRLDDRTSAALARFKLELEQRFAKRLLKVVLFGSYATGRRHDDSDVDLLILVSQRLPRDGHSAVDAAVSVMLEYPDVVLSPLVSTPQEFADLKRRERRLALDIEREGIAL